MEIHDLPTNTPVNLRLMVFFHKSQEWVGVEARIPRAKGFQVQQLSEEHVFGQVLHEEGPLEEQCTVTCPKSGESRTGKNVCIECSSGRGTVKVCC